MLKAIKCLATYCMVFNSFWIIYERKNCVSILVEYSMFKDGHCQKCDEICAMCASYFLHIYNVRLY